ncbi:MULTISPECIES: hypothetical protein [Caproicibacterium]|uniref:Uncharacterized protein n=1 Tax=Caproicibacterium argilliputei TaxID=3030016 RepID=A0AA97D791_9FIRM|nr:hypothetical protein [Caproicibacterium argilliputei]WOC31820.1 hypothetical protein PXC00_11570 [Caproicibacterium argilliputei]
MFQKEFKRNFCSMFRQKEFYISFLLSCSISTIPLLLSMWTFYHKSQMYMRPAWSYWGGSGTWFEWWDKMGSTEIYVRVFNVFCMIFLPLLASLAYSYIHYDNLKMGIIEAVIPRLGRRIYYRMNSLLVFLAGFIISAVPFVLQQIILLVMLPYSSLSTLGSTFLTDNYASSLLGLSGCLDALQIAHPYLFNLMTALSISITAGTAALCAFSFSLYFHKNRFVVILFIPFLFFVAIPAILSAMKGIFPLISSYATIGTNGNYHFGIWLIEILLILFINFSMIEFKIKKVKDETI